MQHFRVFFRYNSRPEVDNDATSSVALDYVSIDTYVKYPDSMSNGFQDIRAAHFVMDDERATAEAGRDISTVKQIVAKNQNRSVTYCQPVNNINLV